MSGVLRAANRVLHLPGVEETTWKEGFTFVQAADCQFGMNWTMGFEYNQQEKFYSLYEEECEWSYEEHWSTAFIKRLNALIPRPKFGIICGDMLDAFPERFARKRKEQKKSFDRIMGASEVPLVCVCGNHDVGNSPTPDTIAQYRSDFGDDWFTFACESVLCIVINSQYYEDAQHVKDHKAEQDEWLDEQLKIAKSGRYKHCLVFQHIPWFLVHPDEPKEYFNLHQPLRGEMLEKFHSAGIKTIFCGHYHRNAGGHFKDMEIVVTSAIGSQLGTDKNGFRVVSVTETGVRHKYVEINSLTSQKK